VVYAEDAAPAERAEEVGQALSDCKTVECPLPLWERVARRVRANCFREMNSSNYATVPELRYDAILPHARIPVGT
jgi:hypothetical protein